jgi:hypothetical protein
MGDTLKQQVILATSIPNSLSRYHTTTPFTMKEFHGAEAYKQYGGYDSSMKTRNTKYYEQALEPPPLKEIMKGGLLFPTKI